MVAVSIGPWIEKGFYYDFDPPEPFQEKDLRKIKKVRSPLCPRMHS
jgi:threonyl-tRNA synthetase